MSDNPKVLGYVRVSTNKQEIGPEVQAAALQAEAIRQGWNLELRYEPAASAKSMNNRPVLQEALADLLAGRAEGLAVSKLDRLSRSVADFATLLETAQRQHWSVVCLDLGIDTSTIVGAAMAQVTCTFAEMERKRIGERTREGMARIKADTGKHMGRPSRMDPTTVERINSERSRGGTLAAIAQRLNDEGVRSATGGRWYPASVRRALNQPESVCLS